MPYRHLDAAQIERTAQALHQRIEERFPDAGLAKVSAELVRVARDTASRAAALSRPMWPLRLLAIAATAAIAIAFVVLGTFVSFDRPDQAGWNAVQGIEALINTVVIGGIGLIALIGAEDRLKTRAVLAGLGELRSLVHVVDMHQLTKDPLALGDSHRRTASSPPRDLTPAQLRRYLDYCSEMLSLAGKLAALYAQAVSTPAAVEAVNDLENLSIGLSRKIWQKIALIPDTKARRR